MLLAAKMKASLKCTWNYATVVKNIYTCIWHFQDKNIGGTMVKDIGRKAYFIFAFDLFLRKQFTK